MSKKPLVPVKRPTKGRGKGNDRGLKKLMKEVDSMSKGLKGVKGGGWNPLKRGTNKDDNVVIVKDYYDKLREFFMKPENIANIKRIKEDLVNNVLGTMAGWFNSILNRPDVITLDGDKVAEIENFVSIISDINKLKQGRLDKVIGSKNLKVLPYIEKITTLVMINMLIDVYKSKHTEPQIEDNISFIFLDNTRDLIAKIIEEYNMTSGGKSTDTLKNLIEEVKRELKYYTEIYKLRDYVYKEKSDDTDVEKIITELKVRCKEVEEDDFKKFINSSNINSNDFSTGCDDDILKNAIEDYNEFIKKMKGMKEFTTLIEKLNANSLYLLLLSGDRDTRGLLSLPNITEFLHDLYNCITTYENKFKDIKGEYIRCVKPFFDDTLLNKYQLKEELTPEKKGELKKASVTDAEITNLENEITRIRETIIKIKGLKENNTGKFYNNIPFDMKEIIGLFNILCNANTIYNQYMSANNIKEKEFKAAAEKIKEPYEMVTDEGYVKSLNYGGTTTKILLGGKLTTKYISTGDFVYILYEKKRIRRCVYAKAKGRGKYCKIKGNYILLSKLKVV
jgi:hypothetical protein